MKKVVKSRGGKKTVAEKPSVKKKRVREETPFVFIECDAEEFFERLHVLKGILRQQKTDQLRESNFSASVFPDLHVIENRLVRLFLDLEDLPIRGFANEFGWFGQAMALWIHQIIPIYEDDFEDVKKHGVSDKIFAYFKQEWDRRAKSPDRKAAAIRDSYQAACKQAMLGAIILHEGGVRKHWLRPSVPMPVERWGSTEGKANWQTWIRAFLTELHKSGELFRYYSGTPAKEDFAGARAKSRDRFFSELYIISINFMQPVLQSTARMLYTLYSGRGCPEPFKQQMFIDLVRNLHPEVYSPTKSP